LEEERSCCEEQALLARTDPTPALHQKALANLSTHSTPIALWRGGRNLERVPTRIHQAPFFHFLFVGVLGEYNPSIHTYVQNRPVMVKQGRLNLDADDE
jgi:hypothetical protein